MRGTVSRLLPAVCAAGLVGCGLPGANGVSAERHAITLPSRKADGEKTLAYWNGVKRVVERTGPSDLSAVSNLGRQKAEAIRNLPTAGVDAELVERAEAAALHLDHFIVLSATAGSDDARQTAARAMLDANGRLVGIREALAARYKTPFPPLPVVGCPAG